jgi:DNA-binding response OmpR family regulator
MPVLDGYAALEKIKSDDRWRDVSVIMVTAVDKIESVAKCIQFGAEDYMPKLFNPLLLQARIEGALEKQFLRRRVLELEEKLKQS